VDFNLNIAIVGMGLIGGSYGMSLKRIGFKNVIGVDIDREILKKAEAAGAIDSGCVSIEEVLPKADIVVVSVYPELTKKLIIENMDKFKPGAIITDVAGIKEKLIEDIVPYLRDDLDFVAGHPMAGKESSGIESADPDIFVGANYILTPTDRNKLENIETIRAIVKAMGFKNVVETSPSTHDENIAYVSQLPHIVAVGMVNCKDVADVNLFAGGSYRDTTRIARINAELWSELFVENKSHLVEQIDLFLDYTKNIRDAIEAEDMAKLKEMLRKSHDRKGEIKNENA
jgi:prephenate dehydrogenase